MKSFGSIKCLAFLALAAAAYAVQDPLLLRRELKEGTTEKYKIESVVKQLVDAPSFGEQDLIVTTVSTCDVKFGKIDPEKKNAEIETTTKVEKLSMEGALAAMLGQTPKPPEPKTEKGTLDAHGKIVMVKDPNAKKMSSMPGMDMLPGLEMAGSAASLLACMELPENPVKIGDSWDLALPASLGAGTPGVKDPKMTVKLVGEKDLDGRAVYVFATTGSFKLDMDTSKMPKKEGEAPPQFGDVKMTGSADLVGEALVDKSTGQTIAHTMKVQNKTKVYLSAMGMEIPVNGTIDTTLKLQK